MGFKDRYGITDFVPENSNQGVSLSIDDFDEIMAVLLLVPDKAQHDHDHIHIPVNKLFDFKHFLTTLGQSKFESGRYQIYIHSYNLKNNTVDLEVYTTYQGQKRFDYKMTIPRFSLEAMNAWVEELEKLTPEELSAKYHRDVNRK